MISPDLIPKVMPTIMIVLSALSCVVYAWNSDWKNALYWFSGCLITFSVTWMK